MYISTENSNKLRKIAEIADAYLPEALIIDLDYDASLDDVVDKILTAFETRNIDADVKYGVSKIAIIPEDIPYVLKVSFEGFYSCEEEYVNNFDYCEEEETLYKIAEADGFGDFFAETAFFLTGASGHAFYVQEKSLPACDEDEVDFLDNSVPKKISNNSTYLCSKNWTASCYEVYGENCTNAFINYIYHNEYFENGIKDLHSGNYGWTSNGKCPVIFDYSGWLEKSGASLREEILLDN